MYVLCTGSILFFEATKNNEASQLPILIIKCTISGWSNIYETTDFAQNLHEYKVRYFEAMNSFSRQFARKFASKRVLYCGYIEAISCGHFLANCFPHYRLKCSAHSFAILNQLIQFIQPVCRLLRLHNLFYSN